MPRKIVRDVNLQTHKDAFVIEIKDEDVTKIARNKPNLVDISAEERPYLKSKQFDTPKLSPHKSVQSKKNVAQKKINPPSIKVLPATSHGIIKDVQVSGSSSRKTPPSKFLFFAFTPKNLSDKQRASEIVRLFAVGTLILFIINITVIYQRGIVLKDKVANAAFQGYEQMLSASQQTTGARFSEAEKTFQQAQHNFNEALQAIAFLQTNEQAFFTHEKTVDSIQNLLQSAKSLATAGQDFSRGLQNLRALPELLVQFNQKAIDGKKQLPGESLTEKLKKDLEFLDKATKEVESANAAIQKVSPDVLPPSFRDKLIVAKEKIATLHSLLTTTQELLPAVLDLLGDRYPHRYLILLQNDAEARPTGGFIGSYLLVDINDGYITHFSFEDVYQRDGRLKEEIPAPEDIARISKNWRMRDSNYSPDFAISAEKAAWFLQKEGGPSVDTVIAVNQSLMGHLLAVTGPVQVEGLAEPLDASNWQLILSYIIESKLMGTDNPKKILGDFITAFQAQLLKSETLPEIVPALLNAYQHKKILFYSRYENIQKVFDRFAMSGRVKKTAEKEDYLQITATSIGGNKSDQYIAQEIEHNTLIRNNGSISDEVIITRHHTVSDQDVIEWQKTLKTFGFEELSETVRDILGKGINKAVVKVYVPKGSTLIDTAQIDQSQVLIRYDQELDKNYFMFEMHVAPGQEQSVTLIYDLPQKLQLQPVDTYKLFIQHQPSIHDSHLAKQLFFQSGLQSYRQFPTDFTKNENGEITFDGALNKDLYFSALVGS